MSNSLLSLVGWAFLPNLVTGWVQTVYYGISIRAGDPKPQPGSTRYVKHRRRIHVAVIITYLLYTIYESYYEIRAKGDFYQVLNLSPEVDERGIKSRFRRLAAVMHPDKFSSTGSSVDIANVDAAFVNLRLAADTLSNPTKRFAYDRFGPDILNWQYCSSVRDYLARGLTLYAPTYIVSAIALVVFAVTGYLAYGRFWSFLITFALFILEYHTLTRPYAPLILGKFANPVLGIFKQPALIQFEFLLLARKATLALFIAFSQIGPLLATTASNPSSNKLESNQLQRLEQVMSATDAESAKLLALEMRTLAGDEGAMKDLQGKIKDWLVQSTFQADPMVKDALGRALVRRRTDAPAGARPINTSSSSVLLAP